ncbi:Serine protease family s33, partial [Globisporangium splendens]
MKVAQLLTVVASAAVLAAAGEPPKTPSSVQLNGWYKCSPSTHNRGTADQSDDYYMETKKHHHHKHHKHASAAAGGQTQSVASTAGTHRMLKVPSVLMGNERRATLPFLEQSFEWVSRRREQHESKHHSKHKHHHQKAKHNDNELLEFPQYECGEFRVPMCYEGICNSNRTIDVFVKRVAAQPLENPGEKKKSLWVLQGGPGASSTAMEGMMGDLYQRLEGKVSIYTMDHRGTARSNRLMCEAAQAGTTGSPSGTTISVGEVPACIQDVLFQIDNQTAAFSVTSAAMDLKTVIDTHLSDEDVYVYGLSYGTYLVERLIHFAPESVKGFSVDGIISEAGATVEDRATYSNWDRDVGVVADRFLGHCLNDTFCGSKFPGVNDLSKFTRDLYRDLDKAAEENPGSNACADALASSGSRPSYFLRTTFGDYLTSDTWRIVIPAVIFRASRCNEEDADALSYMAAPYDEGLEDEEDIDNLLYTSEMLYNLIVFSEMWEQPSPDKATLIKWYEDSLMASDNFYVLPYYCLFSGSQEKACTELKNLPKSQSMVYERDQYWNVPAKLPKHASALLMVGGLDVQTRRAYGNLEYNEMEGDKMLVDFKYASHCTTFTTPMKNGDGVCGLQILASFVREDGVLKNVDTSCVDEVYDLVFNESDHLASELFGTRDLYG